jgi:CRISPR system Cascade subunit CasC
MLVELHLLQNFAPSCLNRDDTNSPKEAEFGGYRRARISSQCLKRALRQFFGRRSVLAEDNLGERTKRLVDHVSELLAKEGKEPQQAAAAVAVAVKSVIPKTAPDAQGVVKTPYLLFLGRQEIQHVKELVARHWDALCGAAAQPSAEAATVPAEPTRRNRRAGRAQGAAAPGVPTEVEQEMKQLLNGGKAVDLGLFGRMLADLPDRNIDAACQVAHALSTNKINVEFDFYTAVDDLKPEDSAGADMMGTVEFNSSCFYRYANVDVKQLWRNLLGKKPEEATDEEKKEAEQLAHNAVESFLHASVYAIPTGKQHSMAAQNPPAFVFAVVRERGLWSLANAFVQPVRPGRDSSLVQNSIKSLDAYWGQLVQVYGADGIRTQAVCLVDAAELKHLAGCKVDSFQKLVEQVKIALNRQPREDQA